MKLWLIKTTYFLYILAKNLYEFTPLPKEHSKSQLIYKNIDEKIHHYQ